MEIKVLDNKKRLGEASAKHAADEIVKSISQNGKANIILATGASQFDTISNLVSFSKIDWSKVTMFHLDEYVGMPETHPASFRKYLKKRFVEKVPKLKETFFIKGDSENPYKECEHLNKIISRRIIDVALVGIGENGHLAFNDPPADFEAEAPYLVVDLDEKCRKQQMGEGWFSTIEDVPRKAISMSVKQIIKSKSIVCTVPDKRKAQAVKDCLSGDISNMHPASILQKHDNCTIYLDNNSASLLSD